MPIVPEEPLRWGTNRTLQLQLPQRTERTVIHTLTGQLLSVNQNIMWTERIKWHKKHCFLQSLCKSLHINNKTEYLNSQKLVAWTKPNSNTSWNLKKTKQPLAHEILSWTQTPEYIYIALVWITEGLFVPRWEGETRDPGVFCVKVMDALEFQFLYSHDN